MRITDGISKGVVYCGNKTGQDLHVTGDEVNIIFHSDREIEGRGYLLNFTLVSLSSVSSGKWDHKEADTKFSIRRNRVLELIALMNVNIVMAIHDLTSLAISSRTPFNPIQTGLLGFFRSSLTVGVEEAF